MYVAFDPQQTSAYREMAPLGHRKFDNPAKSGSRAAGPQKRLVAWEAVCYGPLRTKGTDAYAHERY